MDPHQEKFGIFWRLVSLMGLGGEVYALLILDLLNKFHITVWLLYDLWRVLKTNVGVHVVQFIIR